MNTVPQPYLPIPVEAAAQVANSYGKDVVVICAIDRPHDKVHVTTFGRTPIDKEEAAKLGEVLQARMCEVGVSKPGPTTMFEDFRRDAGKIKEENDRLRAIVRDLVAVAERAAQSCPKPSELCDALNQAIYRAQSAL